MPDPSNEPLPLPGLEVVQGRSTDDLERAVRRTLAVLEAEGHVCERDAGKLQLAIELAQVVALKKRTGRASTIGNDARVLMEILDSFVDEAAAADDGDFASVLEQWEEAMRRADAAPEVRDPT